MKKITKVTIGWVLVCAVLLFAFDHMMRADAQNQCSDDTSAMTWQECQWAGNR